MDKIVDNLISKGVKISTYGEELIIRGDKSHLSTETVNHLKLNKKNVISYINKINETYHCSLEIPTSHIVKLRVVENAPIIFFIHPIGGGVVCYQALIEKLSLNYSVYAIQAKGINDGLSPLDAVEDFSNYYEKLILCEQPEGPIYLAGWSFGGVIAYDLACRMLKKNIEIGFLGLIDSTFSWGRSESLINEEILISLFVKDLFSQNNNKKDLAYFFKNNIQEDLTLSAYKYCLENEIFDSSISYKLFTDLLRVFKSHNKAHIEFQPLPCDLLSYHFIASEKSEQSEPSIRLWRKLTNNQAVIRIVPGNHYTIFSKKNIQNLATEFNQAFNYAAGRV